MMATAKLTERTQDKLSDGALLAWVAEERKSRAERRKTRKNNFNNDGRSRNMYENKGSRDTMPE